MKFAKIVFTVAGVWGIVVLTPLYWLVDVTGRSYSPPTDYPQFFYGFLGVADSNVMVGAVVLLAINLGLWATCYVLLRSGWKLKP